MKKILIFTTILIIAGNAVFAQNFKTVIGEDENGVGDCLMIMKNGNSVFKDSKKGNENYFIAIYDGNLKRITEKELIYKTKDLADADYKKKTFRSIEKCFEINGKIVLFVLFTREKGEKELSMYRIIMNATTANIEKEELLFTINKIGNEFLNAYGVDNPQYIISKDENSDYYAIIKYITQKRDDVAGNYEVHHYSPDNKEISSAKFDYVDNTYEFARPLSLMVFADKYVLIANFAFNSERKKDKDTKVVFSKLEKGKSTFTHKGLNYSENFSTDQIIMKNNGKYNIIQTLVFVQNRNYKNEVVSHSLVFQSINPETMDLYKPYSLSLKKLNEYAEKNCDQKEAFDKPRFKDFQISPKGNNIAFLEKEEGQRVGGKLVGSQGLYGFSEFDANGVEINAWAYPSVAYNCFSIFTSKGNYMLIDEMEENMDRPMSKKYKDGDSDKSNAVLLSFKDNGEISKEYVFGQPENKKNNYVHDYFYDEKSKTMIARIRSGKYDKDGKNEKLVKIKFE